MGNKYLLIVGPAPCAAEDLTLVEGRHSFDYLAVAHGAVHLPHIHHLVSCEADFVRARNERAQAGLNVDYPSWSTEAHPGADVVVPDLSYPSCSTSRCKGKPDPSDAENMHHYSGGSTLFAVKIGLRLGYEKIVIAGAPMEGRYGAFHKGWLLVKDLLACCPVRGISGFPARFLGEYTEEWLTDGEGVLIRFGNSSSLEEKVRAMAVSITERAAAKIERSG